MKQKLKVIFEQSYILKFLLFNLVFDLTKVSRS